MNLSHRFIIAALAVVCQFDSRVPRAPFCLQTLCPALDCAWIAQGAGGPSQPLRRPCLLTKPVLFFSVARTSAT